MTTATDTRNKAITQVATNTDPTWWNKAIETVIAVARTSFDFTTDDIWEQLKTSPLPTPHEPRALGAVMIAVQRCGIITATEKYRQSTRPECHARPIRVWQAA